jgi:large repetitive protein
MSYARLPDTPSAGSLSGKRTTAAHWFALLLAIAVLGSAQLIAAGRANAEPVQQPTQVLVQKVDAVTGAPLANAHFTFYDHLNVALDGCLTDATGFCHINGVTLFSYKVGEDTPPPGYMRQPGLVTLFPITNPQDNPPTIFRDQPTGTSLQQVFVKKVDATTGAPLANASFRLLGFAGEVVACTTDQHGMCHLDDVPQGSYEWKELVAPPGYDLATHTSPVTVTIGEPTAIVTVNDGLTSAVTSTLTVQKVDAETQAPLAGVQFTLKGGANATCTTDANGRCSISGLSIGTYSWHETAAPTGYATAADSPDIVITDANAGTTFTSTVVADAELRTDLTVQKVDANDPAHTLAGATFELTDDKNPAGVVGRCTTTVQENGSCTVRNLPFGTYVWSEVSPPAGFDLPTTPASSAIHVRAQNAGTTRPTTVVGDQASRSTLSLKKVDAADHTLPVDGAAYRLYRESNGVDGLQTTGASATPPDSPIGLCTTAADGTCSIAEVPDGTYYWLEVKAPAGYALSTAPSDAVVVDSSTAVTTTVSDARLSTPSTPSTPVASSQNDHQGGGLAFTGAHVLGLLGTASALLAAGGLLLLLGHRRRRTI